ncbi:MAG TPA: hypothetical protein VF487_15380 [Chitinophagaceae bacterium]
MIQLLATRYPKHIAYLLFLVFLSGIAPVYGNSATTGFSRREMPVRKLASPDPVSFSGFSSNDPAIEKRINNKTENREKKNPVINATSTKADIGGPASPEMSSFKSASADNMVNLFTGDFSYNIPLMDVGGYPINIFYDGSITMEQEASWVGLGWNINPGTVNRNMRGVPDDFNGEDTLIQTQDMKPNKTWGLSVGADLELYGIKESPFENFSGSVGASLGVSFNNYLGPAMDLGLKGTTSFKIAGKANAEKNASLAVGGGLNVNLSSRNGFTLSPNVSLTASAHRGTSSISNGLSLATSYNSRTGIKSLQISDQVSFNDLSVRYANDRQLDTYSDGSRNATIFSTSISFVKPSYIPSLRMPVTNSAGAGRFQLGIGMFGGYGSVEAEVYIQKAEVAFKDRIQKKPLVGYLYYQKAQNNPNAVMDFTRFNDNEVTPNTPVISAPQYSYDVFSIQGEGTGGSVRAYRNDHGYVRDNYTRSQDKSLSLGADVGPPGHYGGNFNTVKTPSYISEWNNNNKLHNAVQFKDASGTQENVYFRNPGETSVLTANQFEKIGGTDLVRYKLGGNNYSPSLEPILEQFSKDNKLVDTSSMLKPDFAERKKRTQVTSFLTAEEATVIGLDTAIKNYNSTSILDGENNLQFAIIKRVSEYRKKHHISQVNVTEADGKRYVYGIPVYNRTQKDFSFSVNNTESGADPNNTESGTDQVNFDPGDATTVNTHNTKDGYLQITETPPYAHSFLLSGLLSPDYVDVTGNGITEDDLGNAVKFNYSKFNDHEWRTPLTTGYTANFNGGNRTEIKDDKGLVSYGKRESWYVHSIESKTMIALFTVEDRVDGKGAAGELNGVNSNDNSLKRLKKIDLYSKADLKKNGLATAKPVKTVWFAYSYTLCLGTPDNTSGGGKLTLDSIYFTFNGKNRINKNKYAFSYGNNPNYEFNAADRWGNYKSKSSNPGQLKNSNYPYSLQDKSAANQNAAPWALKKILLPSGGQLEVEYESDDYAFVQNKRAATMMEIVGLGKSPTAFSNQLYGTSISASGIPEFGENDYVFIKVPSPCANKQEVLQKYLQGVSQLAFKLKVQMPKGEEYVNSYATIADYDKYDDTHIWVKINTVDGHSPLTLTALSYLREQLPGQAYEPSYDIAGEPPLSQVAKMLEGMFTSITEAFKDPINRLREKNKAKFFIPGKSFVRLNDPDGYKYGGGQRVKSVKLKDNWQAMITGQYASEYGQEYNYETTEIFNGVERTISSGVASYEPSIGGEENPFQTMVQVENKIPLGPTSYGAIEMPVLDAFFPAPLVGYSKVTVRSLKKGDIPAGKKSRSGIGKQVTQFYTAKDFPVYYNHTSFDPSSDMQEHKASLTAFFYKYAFDSRALSQGFIVETNDMHGKMKSQASYPENDSTTRISYTENFYRNTGSKGLAEKFDFVYASEGGVIKEGNMGIDVELMTDTREFSVQSKSLEIQGQVDLVFPFIPPLWVPFIWGVAGESENTYRAVTTTKVVNYHSILDSVVVIDKGSQVSTKNLVYDAETGDVVVNRTNNEFDQPIYSVNYPAYWAYSGMGLAYKNIDAVYSGVKFRDGKITEGITPSEINKVFESGDELYLVNRGSVPTDNCGSKLPSVSVPMFWAFDKTKNASSLTNITPDIVFIDSVGRLANRDGVSLRVVRSGKRNMLSASVASAISMNDPRQTVVGNKKLVIDNVIVANSANKVINASAVEYKEKWQTDNDVIRKLKTVFDPNLCMTIEEVDCNGYLEKKINPYRKGLLGNFRTYRSMVFYENRAEIHPLAPTNLKQNGFLSNFKLYWDFNSANNLVPDNTNTKWVWNSQITRVNAKGMELETKDALNIYTSAQYGYNKTTPVAIANNARYNEMFYEGFEDKDYLESINKAAVNICTKKHIDFAGMTNSQIINSSQPGFNAHSGNNVMEIAGNIAVKNIAVSAVVNDEFSLINQTATTEGLFEQGGNIYTIAEFPANPISGAISGSSSWGQGGLVTPASDFLCKLSAHIVSHPDDGLNYSYAYRLTDYFEIENDGVYTFKKNLSSTEPGTSVPNMIITITSVNDGTVIPYTFLSQTVISPISHEIRYSICLKKGIYKVESVCEGEYNVACNERDCFGRPTFNHSLKFEFLPNPVSYKSISTQTGCAYTKPIAASELMLNPVFSIPSNKKMVFSAWVRESNILVSSYANNEVQIDFGSGNTNNNTIKPTGPIIEGWQRYEGYFTAPSTVSEMNLKFVNNSGQPIYFDDIRIHPFNANMKSYVYDPVSLRLTSELDANNYASFYEYDEEGGLIRTKAETKEGIKTINETRSFKQRGIKEVQ